MLSRRQYASIRRWQRPREKTLAKVQGRRVYLFVHKDLVIEADLYDEMYRESNGQLAPELVIACPRCNSSLRINGFEHPITVQYLEKPRSLTMPDTGEQVEQTVVVSVEGVRRCPSPAPAGKGACGWACEIRENRVY